MLWASDILNWFNSLISYLRKTLLSLNCSYFLHPYDSDMLIRHIQIFSLFWTVSLAVAGDDSLEYYYNLVVEVMSVSLWSLRDLGIGMDSSSSGRLTRTSPAGTSWSASPPTWTGWRAWWLRWADPAQPGAWVARIGTEPWRPETLWVWGLLCKNGSQLPLPKTR